LLTFILYVERMGFRTFVLADINFTEQDGLSESEYNETKAAFAVPFCSLLH